MNPKIIVEQKITAFTNKYMVYGANPDGSKAQLIAFAQQKKLAFKEKVTFFTDESSNTAAFTFRAEKLMDIHGRYFVEDASGNLVGMFKKEFAKSLVSSTWNILDQQGNPKITLAESNQTQAIVRRFGDMVPLVGGIIELVTMFLKYHFTLTASQTNTPIGTYMKTSLLRDNYVLSMTDESYATEDWRVLASMAVALDALQSR